MDRSRPHVRITPNLIGIAFGIAGLAQVWSTANAVAQSPEWVATSLWLLAGIAWLVTAGPYVVRGVLTRQLWADLADPIFSPFTALAFIVPMLLGVELARYQRGLGETVFFVALALTVLLGGWLSGGWIVVDANLAQWHPGYFLPTVAGGLIGAAGCAQLGYLSLARFMFGYGMICWLVLGSILLTRLFTQPRLPIPLLPTMAIEVAPPVVAGGAWFAINGSQPDAVALGLAGYGVLMVMVQLRLIPLYAGVPFGVGWWSFSFSYAAAFSVGIRWLGVEQVPGQQALTYLLLAVVTAGIAALLFRTVVGLRRGTFLPRQSAVPEQRKVSGRQGR